MRIIENNYAEVPPTQEYEIVCPHCKSKLVYETYDVCSCNDDRWIYCEACGKEINISEDDEFPTAKTIQYPKDFFSYADGVPVKDTEINKWVKDCINDLDKDTDYAFRASGDTMVFAYKSDADVPSATVIVAKKYQECEAKISQKNF